MMDILPGRPVALLRLAFNYNQRRPRDTQQRGNRRDNTIYRLLYRKYIIPYQVRLELSGNLLWD